MNFARSLIRFKKSPGMALKHGRVPIARPRITASSIQKLFGGAGILIAVLLVVLFGAGFFLTYRIATAQNEIENLSPSTFLLPSYESVGFHDANGAQHEGWLLVGLKGAPVIVMCPGYDSNRSDLLYLGVVLQANHFNVYLFNFTAEKSGTRFSNLGVHEISVLQSALDMLMKRPGINSHRVGLYGNTLGGYAALVTAEKDMRVRALAVDSIYETPRQMFDDQMDRLLGGTGSLFRSISGAEFHLLTLGTRFPPARADLIKLGNCSKLFIAGEDVPHLRGYTEDLYKSAPDPKRLLIVPHTEANLASGSERKEYESQVLNFFLQNLSLRID
jgi:pimeloyl-ACP methyl ester carboxylesterase